MAIKPISLKTLEDQTDNLYEAVVVAGKRARQINENNRLEFNHLISEMVPAIDEDFEERGNPDQEKVSLQFEKKEKPHLQALNELLDDEIKYRYKDTDTK